MYYISWDIGIKNLAYLKFKIKDGKLIARRFKCISLLEGSNTKVNRLSPSKIMELLATHLKSKCKRYTHNVEKCFIEGQYRRNKKALLVYNSLEFFYRYHEIPVIKISPKQKYSILCENNTRIKDYQKRKKQVVKWFEEILERDKSPLIIPYRYTYRYYVAKKKDDIADCFLMSLCHFGII